MRSLRVFVAIVATWLSAPAARADSSPQDVVAATALYEQGVKLLGEKRYAEACPKLIESQKLDPGGGTLVAIALCHEGEGRLATAWADWNLALTQARAASNPRRIEAATEHIAALSPRLSKLRIVVPEGAPAGLEIKRAGASIGRAQWGVALPIDAGECTIEALVSEKPSWRTTVLVREEGATVDVNVPPLDANVPPLEASVPPLEARTAEVMPPPQTSRSSRRIIALVMGGAGLAAIGVGTYFGLTAHSKWSDAQSNDCHDTTVCNATGVTLADDAKRDGNLATAVFAGGLALVAAGAVLWLTAPSSSYTGVLRAAPMVTASGGGLVIGGSFQ